MHKDTGCCWVRRANTAANESAALRRRLALRVGAQQGQAGAVGEQEQRQRAQDEEQKAGSGAPAGSPGGCQGGAVREGAWGDALHPSPAPLGVPARGGPRPRVLHSNGHTTQHNASVILPCSNGRAKAGGWHGLRQRSTLP